MNPDRASGGLGRFESFSLAENGHAMSEDPVYVSPIEGALLEYLPNEGDAYGLTEDEDAAAEEEEEEEEEEDNDDYENEDEDRSMKSENDTLELEIKETV